MQQFTVILASHVRLAAKIREDSWCDWMGNYEVSMQDACIRACQLNPDLAKPVEMLLDQNWNMALDWANDIVVAAATAEDKPFQLLRPSTTESAQ